MKAKAPSSRRNPLHDEARKRWPKAVITGAGMLAVRIPCGERYQISLFEKREDAEAAMAAVKDACGAQYCTPANHRIFDLRIPRQ